MQQNKQSHSSKRLVQFFGTFYSKTRQVSKRAYEWSFTNALLATEILAFFIWGTRFHSTNKTGKTGFAKRQKRVTEQKRKAEVMLEDICFMHQDCVFDEHSFRNGKKLSSLSVNYATLGKARVNEQGAIFNAIVLLDSYHDESYSPSFWFLSDQKELFGKGKPLDAEKFFHIHLNCAHPEITCVDLIDLYYRLMTEKLKVSQIQVITATSRDMVSARLWRTHYPEFVSCMHTLQ